MAYSKLFAAGAAHIDRRGRVIGPYIAAASNPGMMSEEIGGGAFNALRNATRHGVEATMLSLRGGDMAGEAVAREIAANGIKDLSATFLDRTTPSYTALLEENGELIAGFADMGLYETGFEKQFKRRQVRDGIVASDAILCEANITANALEKLIDLASQKPVFAIAISPAKAGRLLPVLQNLSCLFMNIREVRVLSGLEDATALSGARKLKEMGLQRGVITSGSAPLTAFDETGYFTITSPKPEKVLDVTGAGDAVAGVTIANLMQGKPLREAVRNGIAAAVLTIQSPQVVADYSDDDFKATLSRVEMAVEVA